VAIIGTGAMGGAILRGLLAHGIAPGDLIGVDAAPARQAELTALGVRTMTAEEAASTARTIVVAVKPYAVTALLDSIASSLRKDALVVSVAAGISTTILEEHLADAAVVRVMPNTPARVGEGMAAITPGLNVTEEQTASVVALFETIGRAAVVPESLQDSVTAISGSGPAYLLLVVESMIDAGVLLGVPRPLATELAVQTITGTAALLRETGEHPALLRESVTSPGGSTAAALRQLEDHRLKAAFTDAMEACAKRNAELGDVG
jgi:pyrroline-5-carboxylate reductase